jgi:hypothetical protein
MVRAAMLLRAPASPLSRTAAATSASDGATVGNGRPAPWRLASMAFLTSSRKAADLSSTTCDMMETQKKITKLKRKEKCQNQRKMRKEETEIKVRYSDTFTGDNTKKKNSKRKMERKM